MDNTTQNEGNKSLFGRVMETTENKIVSTEKSTLMKYMRFINLINGGLLVAVGIITFLSCEEPSISVFIVSFHLVVFGALLFAFEMRVGGKLDSFVRKNFGFLFSYSGRSFFLFFLATLSYSLVSCRKDWSIAIGVVTTLNTLFNCMVIYKHPGFSKAEPSTPNLNGNPNNSPFVDDIELDLRANKTEAQRAQPFGQAYGLSNDQSTGPIGIEATQGQPGGFSAEENVFAASQETYTVPDVPIPDRPTEPSAHDNPFSQNDNPFSDSSVRDVL